MRSNSDNFNEFQQSARKELRLVVVIDFPTPLYLTSHAGISGIPAGQIDDCIRDVSSTSQHLYPDEGRSEIGSMSFSVIDVGGAITSRFRTELNAGEGLKGRRVQLYRGGAGMAWADFRLEQTQEIDANATYQRGAYSIQCSDIQRSMRKDIFDATKARLSADFLAGATTLPVFDTTGFEPCTHVASFGDQPSGSFYYLRIKYKNGFEIIRATGKTATSFTGCTRGMFGTDDVDHIFPTGTDGDSSVEVQEYVYLELPAPALAYALLTGNIIGGGTLPTPWHLGISTSLVDLPSFENIGEDWFDSSDYTKGLIFRFQSIGKTDGKRFIEREVCLLAGAFLKVGADGKLSMQRMTGVIGSADYVMELGPDNAYAHGALRHEFNRVINTYDIEWSYIDIPGEQKPRFARRNILYDATSIAVHGESKPLQLKFRGLHNERHTYSTLRNRFDALRDRYAGPPQTLPISLLPSTNDLEVGDIVRVGLPNVRDFAGTGTLDRSFEIENISIDQRTGRVSAALFGSTQKADPIADAGAGGTSELPDAWYSSAGSAASASLTIDGSGVMTADGTLTGGSTTRTVFYYLGDLTVPVGVTLTITGNAELRVMGHFQINGTVRVSGGQPANTPGFIGTTYGGRGLLVGNGDTLTVPADRVIGQHSALPVLEIENESGSIVGIPDDMRGSGGGNGGTFMVWEAVEYVDYSAGVSGDGGTGGGSLVIVSRGAGYGVSGESDISGADGSAGVVFMTHAGGSGGGGAPGCLIHLLDGSAVSFPILAGNVVAQYGASPVTGSDTTSQGKAASTVDLGVANARVAYVPASRAPYPEYENSELGLAGNSTLLAIVYKRSATAPTTPTANDGSFNFTTRVLTPPSGWAVTPPAADGNPLYASTGFFSIKGTEGTDDTVTWSTPSLFVLDGAYKDILFRRSATTPATPTGDSPSGWTDEVPAGTATLWMVSGVKTAAGVLVGAWSTPAQMSFLNYRGAYSAVTAYLVGDVVAYQERSYICSTATTGNAPSGSNAGNTYWDLLAGKGDPGDAPTAFTDTIAISTGGTTNLRALADAAGYDGIGDATVTFTIASGQVITGNANGGHGIDTGSWPSGITLSLTIENAGTIRGGGGQGGDAPIANGPPGLAGGDAIYCQANLTVTNTGTIEGGGGGGGAGGGDYVSETTYPGGGGGGGYPNGSGGASRTVLGHTGAAGNSGTTGGGGTGGSGASPYGYTGGTGGGAATAGSAGSGGGAGSNGGSGGAAGYAVRKNGHTVTASGGTITGTVG